MDAYRAVISLHNLGFQLKALEGDKVAIYPAVTAEHAEMIQAIRKEPAAACKAIQHLPQLSLIIFPAALRNYAIDLFQALTENEYVQIVAIRYARCTGETEWVFRPLHSMAHKTVMDVESFEWEGVICLECETERQCW